MDVEGQRGRGSSQILHNFHGYHMCFVPYMLPVSEIFVENFLNFSVRVHSWVFLCNFIEISHRHECSRVNLPHIFRASSFQQIM